MIAFCGVLGAEPVYFCGQGIMHRCSAEHLDVWAREVQLGDAWVFKKTVFTGVARDCDVSKNTVAQCSDGLTLAVGGCAVHVRLCCAEMNAHTAWAGGRAAVLV